MLIRTLILVLSIVGLISAPAQDIISPAFLIPDSLKENANAVVLFSEVQLDVESKNSATWSEKMAITVLNDQGDKYGTFYGFYDNHRKISDISIYIYDEMGNLIERVKSKDIMDYSAISGFSLYEDDRIMYYKPLIKSYPYTIVSDYTIRFQGYMQLPYWRPQWAHDISVVNASLTVSMPANNELRFLIKNIDAPFEKINKGSKTEASWQVSSIKAFREEVLQPPIDEITPNIYIAPQTFVYEGYEGSLGSWESFGTWINTLLENRTALSEETITAMKSLVADAKDTLDMVRLIYNHVQENTRYVSIQLGIGGFQPFDAATVDKVGYGDCKALTNYTKALLESVGINSIYTVVRAGKDAKEITPEFPSQQFNHVILNVPMAEDTVWLECTSQDMPFGYLGEFTDNRYALAITEDSGKLIKTRRYNPENNQQNCNARVSIEADGSGNARMLLYYSGLQYDEIFRFINEDPADQKKWLYKNLKLINYSISDFNVVNNPDIIPSATIDLDIELENYATTTGKRMFIPLNKVSALMEIPPEKEERKFDIYLKQSYTATDTLNFTLPDKFDIEHLPKDCELHSEYGEYISKVRKAGNEIKYTRQLKVNEGIYAAEGYNGFYAFYKAIVKADNGKIVLVREE